MPQENLLAEVKDHVGVLTFNRPEKGNSLTPEMLIRVHTTLEEWAKGSDVRCVLFTGGQGKSFCSGYDISAIPTSVSKEEESLLKENNPVELAFRTIKNFPYPTLAAWNGYCFGAALNLSACCDMRVSVDDTKFGMPPAKLGVVYHAEGLQQFVEALGMSVTRELFMTAATYTALEAKEMGVVSRLYPREIFHGEVAKLAQSIAGNAPIALKNNKAVLNMLAGGVVLTSEEKALAEQLQAEGFASEDLKEGQAAFLEKRKPVFKGR
ncbi:Enoyl-CoA hydratase/isomerase [Desulfatibacillum aliphaticivorans]|uniref:Enoyl-CoA hydratase/isomerase n=1 Tax=Desulfatibacillum aliphaticivorans TaxID=218208 RepID=B8FF67_DESAL|nr:enoyl-CoA hydratase-related protein [Desulfatibacillum aliphaticivorans]ACL03884.1 Enoyl-CoA hydratase/isomerase [Desulfatibacillum aliphaticivorans]